MNRCLLILAVLFCALPCRGDGTLDPSATTNGVLSEARVIKLPQDQAKWYVSVVGAADDARYQEVLAWFSNTASLKELKEQVFFCPVTSDSATYKERYAPNVKGLPTVRVQDGKGVTIYESAGKDIPMTGEGLYEAIAIAANGSEVWLPWRQRHKAEPSPQPDPAPDSNPVAPPLLDPEPQPLDDGGVPTLELGEMIGNSLWWCIAAALTGLLIGQWEQRKAQWAHKK